MNFYYFKRKNRSYAIKPDIFCKNLLLFRKVIALSLFLNQLFNVYHEAIKNSLCWFTLERIVHCIRICIL